MHVTAAAHEPAASGGVPTACELVDGPPHRALVAQSHCDTLKWTGAANAPYKSPCNHLFTPYGAYIYSPVSSLSPVADGKFCCKSYANTRSLGAVPLNWTYSTNYYGVKDGFEGPFYNGEIKIYWMSVVGVVRRAAFETPSRRSLPVSLDARPLIACGRGPSLGRTFGTTRTRRARVVALVIRI